jgi:hypothetical protein
MATRIKSNGGVHWTEYFRVITPFLLLVVTFVGGTINDNLNNLRVDIKTLDTKVFAHLTNDELHPQKSKLLSVDQFEAYEKLRAEQLCSINDDVNEIKNDIKSFHKVK